MSWLPNRNGVCTWATPLVSAGGRKGHGDREDRLFRVLFTAAQAVVSTLVVLVVLAGPFEVPVTLPMEARAVQVRFEPILPVESEPVVPTVVPASGPKEPVPAADTAPVAWEAPPEPIPPREPELPADPAPQTPSRPVYGVRTVLANGLGGVTSSGGIVTRRGNALNGDLTTASEDEEIRASLVPLSTVDAAPEPVHRVLPEYTDEMRRHRSSGTVQARLLIDSEGNVREVEILSDFGMGSADLARRAFERFRFRPARRDGERVSVWIVHKIRFEFQG